MTRRREVFRMFALTTTLVALVALSTTAVAQDTPPGELSQDVSPLRIETLEIEPTVAKTGDLIIQTYRVRFPDLISEGREIIILEDRMTPENLPIHPFEGVSLEILKRRVEDEHVWDFRYGLRLIAPEKSLYVLPGFSFYYLVRDLGEDIEDAEVQQVDGGGGLVRYVTTITELPVLDIRDTIELGSFQTRAAVFRTLAWGAAPLPMLVWFVLLLRHARRPKTITEDAQKEADELERIEAQIRVPPSIWEARRSLRAQIRLLEDLPAGANGSASQEVERNLVISAREYLQAELPELHTGDMPRDIQTHIEAMQDGARKEALGALAERLVKYQSGLERDEPVPIDDPGAEAREFTATLALLRPHIRLLNSITGMFGR